jgi:type II secretory pathway pseudopilin PulG
MNTNEHGSRKSELSVSIRVHSRFGSGFGIADLLVTLAAISILVALLAPLVAGVRNKRSLNQCIANLQKVSQAVIMYADDNQKTLPSADKTSMNGVWWWYKEQVKRYAGLTEKSSPNDKVFACPSDRGYEEEGGMPFYKNPKFDFGSYPFNGVTLPGVPNIAGRQISSIAEPRKTLLVMEFTAHAPLSWHYSKTGKRNSPFYNDAESVVSFVDNHVALTRIYYDGMNAAYTRDPIDGYSYKYSGD